MNNYEELVVWQRAHALLLEVYRKTRTFPREERYGLTSQTRKSALSIGSNLAEGCGRFSPGDFRRFVEHAAGSSKELGYQLLVARDLDYLQSSEYDALHDELDQIQRMLRGLHNYLLKKG